VERTLEEFCAECRSLLQSGRALPQALALMAEKLALVLRNPDFVAATFDDDMPPGRRVLHHDGETDMYVLAHVQEGEKAGKPHSHGASLAIYGTAHGCTEMTEWRRVNPETEQHAVLEACERYALRCGETRAYGPGVIHSTAHPHKTWVIRVTGTDLDVIPRFRFREQQDTIRGAA
jgi:hypothetical protein